jgi:microcystin-dependent protein
MARDSYTDVLTKRTVIAGTGTAMDGVPLLEPLQNIQITVYAVDAAGARSAVPANIFTARTGAAPKDNPFVTDNTGRVTFFADAGDYDIVVHDLVAPARIGDSFIPWAALPASQSGIPRSFLPDQGRGLDDPGDIKMTGALVEPAGWLFCDGRVLPRANYLSLYNAIQTSFNIGGESGAEFRLPDYRDRFPAGVQNMGTQGDANRIPDGILANGIGKSGGQAEVTLTAAQSGVAPHGHADNIAVTLGPDGNKAIGSTGVPGQQSGLPPAGPGAPVQVRDQVPSKTGGVTNHPGSPAASAHPVVPPVQRCHFLIKT